MNETFEYIEAYFKKGLNDEEKKTFEERCVQDENFAGEVASYITVKEGIRQTLLDQKKQLWSDNGLNKNEQVLQGPVPAKRINIAKWIPFAAAACILIAIAFYLFYPLNSPQRFADNYIRQNLTHLSQTMDGSRDSLQKGISAYNSGNYDSALRLFKNVNRTQPKNSDAKQYIGLVFLMKKDYNNAILNFDELAARKLFNNPGLFLKAVALLKRNQKGDKETARKILEQVRDQQLEGKKQAREWIQKW